MDLGHAEACPTHSRRERTDLNQVPQKANEL